MCPITIAATAPSAADARMSSYTRSPVRQVTVDRPDVQGRIAILKVHSRGKTLAPDVDFEKVARRTPGALLSLLRPSEAQNTLPKLVLLVHAAVCTAPVVQSLLLADTRFAHWDARMCFR